MFSSNLLHFEYFSLEIVLLNAQTTVVTRDKGFTDLNILIFLINLSLFYFYQLDFLTSQIEIYRI